ncbi:MAG TPA: rhomboid family intramembrane serine protease, partial [Gaiellaceae bacterium]|nr:rhomboid family intramembrane serine protease [Gaiellaceae bacterium]
TVGLIVANTIVWIWEVTGTPFEQDVEHYGYYPCTVNGSCVGVPAHHLNWWAGAFTSMFMHGGWIHIAGNMLFLWIFGNNVEDVMGRGRFLVWYLVAGLAATAAQTGVTLAFSDAAGASVPNIGASGAIAGVLGAYFVILPRARVLTAFIFGLILLREIPAVWFLGVWILFQAWQGGFGILHPSSGGDVAFFAHIGGFAFGALTVRLLEKRPPLQPAY